MAEQLMKGQQPTWDGQQYSPPGWTRHSQQSYTIETVVELNKFIKLLSRGD